MFHATPAHSSVRQSRGRSRSRISWLTLLAPGVLLLTLILLAGCGGDSGAAASPTDTPLPPATATTAPATATTGTTASGTEVKISNFKFSPSALTVKAGTTVVWSNTAGATEHTVTSDTNLFDETVEPGKTASFTFNQPGTFAYHCTIHPEMTGTITVTA